MVRLEVGGDEAGGRGGGLGGALGGGGRARGLEFGAQGKLGVGKTGGELGGGEGLGGGRHGRCEKEAQDRSLRFIFSVVAHAMD